MYKQIVNPATGRKVNVNGKLGQKVLNNYYNQIGGDGAVIKIFDTQTKQDITEHAIVTIGKENNLMNQHSPQALPDTPPPNPSTQRAEAEARAAAAERVRAVQDAQEAEKLRAEAIAAQAEARAAQAREQARAAETCRVLDHCIKSEGSSNCNQFETYVKNVINDILTSARNAPERPLLYIGGQRTDNIIYAKKFSIKLRGLRSAFSMLNSSPPTERTREREVINQILSSIKGKTKCENIHLLEISDGQQGGKRKNNSKNNTKKRKSSRKNNRKRRASKNKRN